MKYSIAATLLSLPLIGHASDGLGLSVRVGPSYPLDEDTRDASADVGINAGLRYQLPFPGLLTSLIGTSSSIDLEGFQAKDGSDKINYLGLTYQEQIRFSLGPVRPYAGLGVGAYRIGVDLERTVTTTSTFDPGSGQQPIVTTTNSTEGASDNGIRFGGRAMVGVELPWGLFTELSAVVITKLDEVNTNTINLAVGLRF